VGFRKPTGTATAAQVLSGYTFSNASGDGLSGSYNPPPVIDFTSKTSGEQILYGLLIATAHDYSYISNGEYGTGSYARTRHVYGLKTSVQYTDYYNYSAYCSNFSKISSINIYFATSNRSGENPTSMQVRLISPASTYTYDANSDVMYPGYTHASVLTVSDPSKMTYAYLTFDLLTAGVAIGYKILSFKTTDGKTHTAANLNM